MELEITARFKSSRRLAPKLGKVEFGKYKIVPIPTSNEIPKSAATDEYLLVFTDTSRPGDGGVSQPDIEAQLFLSFLSLVLRARLELVAIMHNQVNARYAESGSLHRTFEGTIEGIRDPEVIVGKLNGLSPKIGEQFLRACEVYREALNISLRNATVSFFLLTVAVECLANKVSKKNGSCERFVDFISNNIPDEFEPKDKTLRVQLLKEIYYRHRSGFTHGGKQLPEAVAMADNLQRVYVRNVIDGKEVLTPGLLWFESVVRESLLRFLQTASESKINDLVKDLSLEHGTVMLKAAKDIKAHTPVFVEDIHLD
jgi:hypothetical protein